MHILIVTDAWRPQVNGVVRTLDWMVALAPSLGARFSFLSPADFPTVPMPNYPEIRLALARPKIVAAAIEAARPDAIHIATEGPLGVVARRVCAAKKLPFTTCYHTRYPEYIRPRTGIPNWFIYWLLRWFHNGGAATLVASADLGEELRSHGLMKTVVWRRGIDVDAFSPDGPMALDLPRPIFLTVSRMAVEKNVEAFLSLDLPGTKVAVGDGPLLATFKRRFPDVHFLGARFGDDLAAIYRSADAFVFSSRTDTLGLVMIEALASGVPVAAFPVQGPRTVIGDGGCGVMNDDLRAAAIAALDVPRAACLARARDFSMIESTRNFLSLAARGLTAWAKQADKDDAHYASLVK